MLLRMIRRTLFIGSLAFMSLVASAYSQTTAFTYQGRLTDGGSPANGNFQMQFKLYDSLAAGSQIGSTLSNVPVTVANGDFATKLDFGAVALSGANRWLEIAVRRNSGESYVTLSPREQIASSPYAVRTISAAMADDSQKLGGVAASEYVTNTNGGTSFIRNQTTLQATSNFNISGDGSAARMFVGAPTALPGSAKLVVNSGGFGITHHNGTVNLQTLINAGTGFFGTTSSHPFGLITNGTERMTILTNGSVGIGTTLPTHTLDVNGFFRAAHNAGGNVVSETTGGQNSWAKFWARTPVQTWSIGTSNDFNGNQLYFSNENQGGGIRMAIMPDGKVGIGTAAPASGLEVRGDGFSSQQRITDNTSGNSLVLQAGAGSNMKIGGYNYGSSAPVPLYLSPDGALTNVGGSMSQPQTGYGLPKAMVFLNGDATIIRCYNGITGPFITDCGFSAGRVGQAGGSYRIDFGSFIDLRSKFYLCSVQNGPGTTLPVSCQFWFIDNQFPSRLIVDTLLPDGSRTDRPTMIVVY